MRLLTQKKEADANASLIGPCLGETQNYERHSELAGVALCSYINREVRIIGHSLLASLDRWTTAEI